MLRTLLGILVMGALFVGGSVAPAAGEKKEKRAHKNRQVQRAKVAAKQDYSTRYALSVEYNYKGEERKEDIKLGKVKLIRSGRDIGIPEFLLNLEVGDDVVLFIDEGHIVVVIHYGKKKKAAD